jgi:hypothetical protein
VSSVVRVRELTAEDTGDTKKTQRYRSTRFQPT